MLFCVLGLSAQNVKQDSVRVYFRQGQSVVDLHYRDNTQNFARLSELYRLYANRSEYWLKGIRIVSSASPEATFRFNQCLSEKRADAVLQFLKLHSELDSTLLKVNPLGEDWQGLSHWVESMPDVPERDAVLRSLDAYPHGQEGEWDLKRIAGGEAYRYLYKHIYPLLRQTHVVFDVRTLPPCPDPVYSLEHPTIYSAPLVRLPMVAHEETFMFALKTNLLYDALSWLNFSLEVPLGDRFSALYYHQFPWWRWGEGNNEYCMRFLSIGAEGRWWFKPTSRKVTEDRIKQDKLLGHFVGVYAESGKWDFERKRDICYQGEHWSVGLSYGYAMPIGKRMNLEFSLSAGYASIPHRGYEPATDYSELYHLPEKDGTWHYFGLTKAQVSLVLPLEIKYKKGGTR